MLLPSIKYSLSTTSLDNNLLEQLGNFFMPTLLQKMKLSKSYPKALVYSYKKFFGNGFFHLKSLHIFARTTYLIKYSHHQSYIGNTARAMINWAQQAVGISTPILTTHSPIPYLESKWINQLQHNLLFINTSIYIHDTWTYPTARQHDCHIMDQVTTLTSSSSIIWKLNYFRLYLQITHLSDITTSDGTCLIESALTNPSEFFNQQLNLNWPIQDPIDPST
eukprot:9119725-Ditylum_brightwellii.AAC.1